MALKRSYNGIPAREMKQFLEEKYLQYNNPSFIESDPVSIPHAFSDFHDREISGFLVAAIAWGRRDLILRSARKLIDMMDNKPYDFIHSADNKEIERFSKFVYRTFNETDCKYFIKTLRNIYSMYSGMEDILLQGIESEGSLKNGIIHLRDLFFSLPHHSRTEKHFADIKKGAAGKRLNIFIRVIKVA